MLSPAAQPDIALTAQAAHRQAAGTCFTLSVQSKSNTTTRRGALAASGTTSAGAVSRPRTVQIRVQRAYPGRIRAGAPVPTRSMDAAEIERNLRFFTEGQKGPRKRPATTLVLSGVGVVSRPDTPALLALARQLGLERIVLHCGTEDLETLDPSPFADAVYTDQRDDRIG